MRSRCLGRILGPASLVALVVMMASAWPAPAAGAEPPGAAAAAGRSEIDLSPHVPAWAQRAVLGVALWQMAATFVLVLAGLVLKKVSDHLFKARIIPLLKRTPYAFDHQVAEAASRPVGWALVLLALAGAFAVLPLPERPNVAGVVFGALKVLLAADVVWFLFRLVDVAVAYLTGLAARTDSTLDDQLIPAVRKALKAAIAVIGFVWGVQLLGYSVSGLIAGLGIGGLAVALALQDTLGNFFGSIVIFIDRPFVVGDWVKIGDAEGVVEEIGFRSTRIRTWPATLVTIPNKTVAAATIDNWSRMPKRRVSQTVRLPLDTTPEKLTQAVDAIREIVQSDEGVHEGFKLVCFTDFGESSLDILLYYFTAATAWADHLAVRSRINLAILRRLDALGLALALPAQQLRIEPEPANDGPQPRQAVSRHGGAHEST